MAYCWCRNPKTLIHTPLLLILIFVVACGGASATTVPQEQTAAATAAPQEQATPEPTAIRAFATPTTAPAAGAQPAPTAKPTATSVPEPSSGIKSGGTIPMAAYAAPSIKAIHEWGYPTDQIISPGFNTLVEFNSETADPDDLRCDLCQSWELGDDIRTYTFSLRDNARWQDGTPITSRDVMFSLNSMIDKASVLDKDGNAILAEHGRSAIVKKINLYTTWPDCCRAIDDKTVEVKVNFPSSAFLPTLALETLNMIPAHSVLDEGKIQTLADWENYNGSGPFRMVEFDPDVGTTFEKNDDYMKEGYPRIDSIEMFVILDPGTTFAAYETGQVLMSNGMVTNLSVIEALKLGEDNADKLTVHWGGPAGIQGIGMNTTKKPFDDVRVRRAMMLALHRQPIIETLSGGMNLLGTPLPPGLWFSYTNEEAATYPGFRELDGEKHPDDLAEAKRLLAEAGVPAEGFKITLSARNCCSYPDIAQIVADQLRRFLGWDVTLRTMESAAGFEAYDAGDYTFMAQGTSFNLADPDAAFRRYVPGTMTRWNAAGARAGEGERYYTAEGVQALFDAQKQEPDREKRKTLVLEAAEILLNKDNAYPALMWEMRHWPVYNKIQGFNVHPSIYAHLKHEEIWCDPAC